MQHACQLAINFRGFRLLCPNPKLNKYLRVVYIWSSECAVSTDLVYSKAVVYSTICLLANLLSSLSIYPSAVCHGARRTGWIKCRAWQYDIVSTLFFSPWLQYIVEIGFNSTTSQTEMWIRNIFFRGSGSRDEEKKGNRERERERKGRQTERERDTISIIWRDAEGERSDRVE